MSEELVTKYFAGWMAGQENPIVMKVVFLPKIRTDYRMYQVIEVVKAYYGDLPPHKFNGMHIMGSQFITDTFNTLKEAADYLSGELEARADRQREWANEMLHQAHTIARLSEE